MRHLVNNRQQTHDNLWNVNDWALLYAVLDSGHGFIKDRMAPIRVYRVGGRFDLRVITTIRRVRKRSFVQMRRVGELLFDCQSRTRQNAYEGTYHDEGVGHGEG